MIDYDERHDRPIRVELLDTETGERVWGQEGYSTYWWTEGNGADDCNRIRNFDGPFDALTDLMAMEGDYFYGCLGCHRFLVVGVNPLLPGYTLADFNRGYPAELVDRYGCG